MKIEYKIGNDEKTGAVELAFLVNGDLVTLQELPDWKVKDYVKIMDVANKATHKLTGRHREVLSDMEKYGFITQPSYTQIFWTDKGAEVIRTYLIAKGLI